MLGEPQPEVPRVDSLEDVFLSRDFGRVPVEGSAGGSAVTEARGFPQAWRTGVLPASGVMVRRQRTAGAAALCMAAALMVALGLTGPIGRFTVDHRPFSALGSLQGGGVFGGGGVVDGGAAGGGAGGSVAPTLAPAATQQFASDKITDTDTDTDTHAGSARASVPTAPRTATAQVTLTAQVTPVTPTTTPAASAHVVTGHSGTPGPSGSAPHPVRPAVTGAHPAWTTPAGAGAGGPNGLPHVSPHASPHTVPSPTPPCPPPGPPHAPPGPRDGGPGRY